MQQLNDALDVENDLNTDAVASSAADHCAWRKFVVTCSAVEC